MSNNPIPEGWSWRHFAGYDWECLLAVPPHNKHLLDEASECGVAQALKSHKELAALTSLLKKVVSK